MDDPRKDYWPLVVKLGQHPALPRTGTKRTIHHCHGGSIKDCGIFSGMGRKSSDWLVVCLEHDLHVGNRGIDYGYGVLSWERDFMRQFDIICWTGAMLGINPFRRAGYDIDY